MGILDPVLRMFDPLIKYTYQNYEKNYLYYVLLIGFIMFLGLIGYLIYKALT